MFLSKIKTKYIYMFFIIVVFIMLGILFCMFFKNNKYVAESEFLFKTNNIPENYILTENNFKTYSEIIKNNDTYKQINDKLNATFSFEDYSKIITVSHNSNSNTISIKAKLKRENNALAVVEEIDNIFINKFSEIYKDIDIVEIEKPQISGQINDINIPFIITSSVLLGIFFALLYDYLLTEKELKVSKDIEAEFKLKELGEIPINKKKNKIIIPNNYNTLSILRSFDELRTVIQFLNFDKKSCRKILISSINSGEGKSYITANLAISYALSGKKTILIDADMDSGVQSHLFNMPNNIGLSNYLSNLNENGLEIDEVLNKYVKETSINNLNIITSGTVPPNSTELLAGDKINKLLLDLEKYFDVILIDGYSTLNNTNTLILTRFVESTIIITTSNKTTKEELQNVRKDIQNVGGFVLGVVVNKVKLKRINLIYRIKYGIKDIRNKVKDYFYKRSTKALAEGSGRIENVVFENEIIEEVDNSIINDVKENDNNDKLSADNVIKDTVYDSQKLNNEIITDSAEIVAENKKEQEIVKTGKSTKKSKKTSKSKKEIEKIDVNENVENTEKNIEVKIELENKIPEVDEKVEMVETNSSSYEINEPNEAIENKEITEEKKRNIFVSSLRYIKDFVDERKEIIKNKFTKKEEIHNQEDKKESFESLIEENLKNSDEFIVDRNNEYEETKEYSNYEQISMEQIQPVSEQNNEKSNEIFQSIEQYLNDDKTIIVFIDSKNAFCRIFGKECFIEKPIRTINAGNQNQPFYTKEFLKKYKNRLKNNYSLSDEQIKRVDLLIYTSLREYDDALWTDKRMESYRAEAYVNVMAKEYIKFVGETDQDYLLRVHRDRKLELAKAYIDIEYMLDNLWKFNKMKINDKIILQKYASELEVQDLLKNNFEKARSKQNNIFYNNIINATNEIRINEVNIHDDTGRLLEKIKQTNRQEMQDTIEDSTLEKELLEKQKRFKREKTRIDKIEEKKAKKAKKEEKRQKAREAKRKAKQAIEARKRIQQEEARIEEELLTNNLYPKTKYYKDL